MFDPVRAFENQFDRIDDGYLYYPSAKGGGKLLTEAEYDQLLLNYKSASAGKRFWVLMGVMFGMMLVFSIVDTIYDLPDWGKWALMITVVGLLMANLFRVSFAPRRLVKERPDHSPPRSKELVVSAAHYGTPWALIVAAFIISGTSLMFSLRTGPIGLSGWAWTLGSGVLLCANLFLGYRKWNDWG